MNADIALQTLPNVYAHKQTIEIEFIARKRTLKLSTQLVKIISSAHIFPLALSILSLVAAAM